jgi:tetratricopeptide (TPR) repeat protein
MAGLLKKLFASNSSQSQTQTLASDLPPLTDSDFEFLLDQLLQGLAHGWQPDRVETFMLDLGDRGKATAWEAWFKNFCARVTAQSPVTQQRQMGTRLLYISEALNHSPKMQRHAKAFAQYGQQLVTGQENVTLDLIWEYDGADAIAAVQPAPVQPVAVQPAETVTIPLNPPLEPLEPIEVVTQISPNTQIQAPEPEPIAPVAPPETPAPNDHKELIESLFNQGLTKADQGNFAGAIADWDEVLKLNDQIPQVWHNRGSAFGCLGEFTAALESFERAIALLPDSVVAWKDRSYALMKLGRWQDALESWNNTIELRDNVAEAWFQRGCTLEQLDKFDNAQINYRKAIALEPDFEQAKARLEALQNMTPRPNNPDPWSEV